MKGYVRSIFYWAYNMEKMFLSMLGTILVIFAFYAFIDMDGTYWNEWMVNYIPMLGIIFPIAEGLNMSNQLVPLALSYGSRRKETAWGVIVMSHVVMLQLWIFALISHSLLNAVYEADSYLMLCGMIFLVSCGIGNGLGAVVLRFGNKIGMIIYIVMIFLVAGGIGIVSALSGLPFSGFNAALSPLSPVGSAGILAAVIVFDAVMAVAFYLGIRRYEVRV